MSDNSPARLKTFCSEALTLLGVSVCEEDGGTLSVTIPPSRLDLFEGRPSLRLAFAPENVDEGVELVVPGSYALERIIEAVRSRGELSSEALDPVVQPSPAPGIELMNAEARLISSETLLRDLLLVSFRVSLVSDENQDRLFSVLIDTATGEESEISPSDVIGLAGRSQPVGKVGDGLTNAFAAAESAAMDFAREWAGSAQREIDGRLAREISRLDQYYKDVLTDMARGNKSADVRRIQRKRDRALAALTEMEQRYDWARQMLTDATSFEVLESTYWTLLRRLQQDRSAVAMRSLYTDYARIAECDAQIRSLEKAAKAARAAFDPTSVEAGLSALEEERQRQLAGLQKRADAREASDADPDALDHLNDLTMQLDSEKARRIAELQDKFQLKAVVVPVSAGLIRYPVAEYRYSAISGSLDIPFASRQDLITGKLIGPECQSCGGSAAQAFACSCGHLACDACHKTCAGCGKDLCSGCVTGACQVCGGVVCESCRSTCQSCGKMVCPTHSAACTACGKRVCKGAENSCGKVCAICGRDFCSDHIETCPVCGRSICLDHMRACAECGVRACSDDIDECPCCGKPVCESSSTACSLCGRMVCSGCIGGSGFCATCEGLFPASSSVPAIEQILSAHDPGGHRRWLIGEDRRVFVLVRKGARLRIYAIDKHTGAILSKRSPGLLASLGARLRLP